MTDPIWTVTGTQEGPIPVTRLNGKVEWINSSEPDDKDQAVYSPEDDLRITEVTLNGRSELRGEIETVFSGPDWPPPSAIVEPFRRFAMKIYDVNSAAYSKVASTQESESNEVLNAMLGNFLIEVFGIEWESSPGEKVTRINWQEGVEGWKGKEVVAIAGNDPDPKCLYHELISDAVKFRYRFHAVPPPPIPGEPPGINLSNLEWWRYIGLNERHDLAMAIKPYLEDRKAHWQAVIASKPTDASSGAESASRKPEQTAAGQLSQEAQQSNRGPDAKKPENRKPPDQLLTEYKVKEKLRTHEKVAERLGLERSVYFDLKAGRKVSQETYVKAAMGIGCSVDDLKP